MIYRSKRGKYARLVASRTRRSRAGVHRKFVAIEREWPSVASSGQLELPLSCRPITAQVDPMHDDARISNRAVKAATGIRGLDDILRGGFTSKRIYLLEGVPGAGKTTLAMQFVLEGIRNGESALYVTLSETEEEIRAVARSHGWDLANLVIRELFPTDQGLESDEPYTMFHP